MLDIVPYFCDLIEARPVSSDAQSVEPLPDLIHINCFVSHTHKPYIPLRISAWDDLGLQQNLIAPIRRNASQRLLVKE